MPTDEEIWYQEMIDKGYLPDEEGYYHWEICNELRNFLDNEEIL